MPRAISIGSGVSTCTSSSTHERPEPASRSQPVADPGHWLAGRLAVVTGASRGIGAATAEAIAAAGAHVVLAARDEQALDRKSVVEGKSVDLGGRRIIKKKKGHKSESPPVMLVPT